MYQPWLKQRVLKDNGWSVTPESIAFEKPKQQMSPMRITGDIGPDAKRSAQAYADRDLPPQLARNFRRQAPRAISHDPGAGLHTLEDRRNVGLGMAKLYGITNRQQMIDHLDDVREQLKEPAPDPNDGKANNYREGLMWRDYAFHHLLHSDHPVFGESSVSRSLDVVMSLTTGIISKRYNR